MDKKVVSVNTKVLKRITSDISELGKNIEELNENGIYWHINEDNIKEIYLVITGSEGTPYADAPFLFKFEYPEMYPLVPPVGKFCTSDGRTRFNPNLYIEGKICLSILGTWSGPSWTPVMTIKTVIMSIIALVMNNEPLRNEPGWENAAKNEIDDYNNVIEYQSLRHGIINQLTNCQQCFQPLLGMMIERFKRDFSKIIDRIDRNSERIKGVTIIRPRYGNSGSGFEIDYIKLRKEMIELGERFGVRLEPKLIEEIKIEEPLLFEGKPITPKIPASNFEVGFMIKFEGDSYMVKENKNGKKYWRKN